MVFNRYSSYKERIGIILTNSYILYYCMEKYTYELVKIIPILYIYIYAIQLPYFWTSSNIISTFFQMLSSWFLSSVF